MFTLLSFKAFACNVLLLFSLLFPVFVSTREERKNECQNKKKKFSPLFLLVHLSLQPHFLSHTMDLLQRPSFLIDFVGNRKKKREKRGGKLSLLFPLPSFYSLSCERRSLSRARAKLLGDRSEIADDDDTAEQYEYSSFARARAKKHQIFFSEKKKKKNTREERIQTFFSFPRTKRPTRKKKNKEIKRDFQALPKEERTTPFLLLLFVFVFFVLLLLLHLSLLAFTRLLFATAPAFRGHRSTFIVIIILYIFVLFVCYRFCCLGVKNFSLSLFLFLRNDRQTDTNSATTRVREIHDEREVKVLRALLFSFLSSQKRYESFVS